MNKPAETSKFPYRKNVAYWKPEGYDQSVYRNILDTIGNGPLVRLNRVPQEHGLECEFYAKCEFLNPGGSYKDRIAYAMVQDAKIHGEMKPDTRIIVPSSGNTGIGLALVAAVRGHPCTVVSPDKNSDEKMNTMRLLGADVILTPTCAHTGDDMHFMKVAERIRDTVPNSIILDQYSNSVNPMTHYEFLAEEILSALGHLDMIVVGTGTGGTLSGLAHKFKERIPECIVVAVDPKGSLLFFDEAYKPFKVEGIGGDFIPDVLDKTLVDRVEQPNDNESFNMSREIIRKEGLLCGGSSGAVMAAALNAAKDLKLGAGKRVVVMMADGIRNYMTKFVTDQWMEAYLFKEPPARENVTWWDHPVLNLQINTSVPVIKEGSSCLEAIEEMGDRNNVALVVDKNGFYRGAVSKNSFRADLTNPKILPPDSDVSGPQPTDLGKSVSEHLIRDCYKLATNCGSPTVGLVSRILDITPFVVIVERTHNEEESYLPKGIVTPEIVLSYVIAKQKI